MIGFSKCFEGKNGIVCGPDGNFLLAMFVSKLDNTGNQSIHELSEDHRIICSKTKGAWWKFNSVSLLRTSLLEPYRIFSCTFHAIQSQENGAWFRLHSGLCVRSRSPICTVLPAVAPACTCRSWETGKSTSALTRIFDSVNLCGSTVSVLSSVFTKKNTHTVTPDHTWYSWYSQYSIGQKWDLVPTGQWCQNKTRSVQHTNIRKLFEDMYIV